jgi:hypothetical protein
MDIMYGSLFAILAANGLGLNLEKCIFAVSELDFLGHCISAAGVAPLRDNVQVILDFPKPTDCKAMQRFLGMINFYCRFLPGVAGTLRPLTAALSGNPKTLPWTLDMETAFAAAKEVLVAANPLAHPLPGAVLALVHPMWWRTRCPAQRQPPPGSNGSAQPSPTNHPWTSRTWISARSSAHRYKPSVPARGCASSLRRSVTLTSSATHPPKFSARWYTETFGDRYLNTSTEPPTLAGGQPATSSPPGMYGKVSPLMSQPGRRLA